jgi:hypothetical protein
MFSTRFVAAGAVACLVFMAAPVPAVRAQAPARAAAVAGEPLTIVTKAGPK